METLLQKTAQLIKYADAVAIFAGAGMGVDSGLEQYRGDDGLWTRSLIINGKPINYYDLMNPKAFKDQPELAWGLIGHLMEKYNSIKPHPGFFILKELLLQKEYFIVTSNTDQQFQKAGFSASKIFEFHGSVFNIQCGERIECGIWKTPDIKLEPESMIANPPFPVCPDCNSYCRPNVHLFEDESFVPTILLSNNSDIWNGVIKLNLNAGVSLLWKLERVKPYLLSVDMRKDLLALNIP